MPNVPTSEHTQTHATTKAEPHEPTQLQDQVPAFETEIAKQIIERELGRPADQVFQGLTKPIAAASLGQVYRARLASGENKGLEVAVKVQRPDILERVALDMHLIRSRALSCPFAACLLACCRLGLVF
jgi:predicted unusual protein kinase regulating ubiquinone biosynthesis (AarF/ABC1/UbiB family)